MVGSRSANSSKPERKAVTKVPPAGRITLAHGNGGRLMRRLIEDVFAAHLAAPVESDAAFVTMPSAEIAITTDGFTVEPLIFPGGDLGSLAVNGTVNDLAVAGAIPRHLTLAAFLEEGLEIAILDRLVRSAAGAARAAGVSVVAGDTKVLPRGECGGAYFAVTGIGTRRPSPGPGPSPSLGFAGIRPGDRVIVSGPVGDHGTAVMLAREEFGLSGDLRSDCASVLPLAESAIAVAGLRFMRDPTRGGLATVAHEIAAATGFGVRLREAAIPFQDPVLGVCEALGYDPLYLACEGRIVAVAAPSGADEILARWRGTAAGASAAIIGEIGEDGGVSGAEPLVVLQTALGGERILDELEDEPLPRIC